MWYGVRLECKFDSQLVNFCISSNLLTSLLFSLVSVATVFCGVTTKAFGETMFADLQLLEDFWALVEHLLNTVLFALGGLVWGSVIANTDFRVGEFTGKDWGYLFLLYVLLTVIRFFLFMCAFPVTSRIGLKSNK